jgi:large subunit ribosomal protein L19
MNLIEKINRENVRKDIPDFRPGDTLRVFCKIREGDKERIQLFEGVCIKRQRGGNNASFSVRKTSYGIGVERNFPLHSPQIDHIEVASSGIVRRSRLFYLRKLSGKSARIEGRMAEEIVEVADEAAVPAAGDAPTSAH